METDIRPINDADLMPPPQHPMRHRGDVDDDDDDDGGPTQTPIYLPHQPPPHHFHSMNQKTSPADLIGELDKTTYIIIFVAFILGFFMGKTMQPVILRPG